MKDIRFLTEIYESKKTLYYLIEAWGGACLIRTPTIIINKQQPNCNLKLDDLSLLEVKELTKIPIDCNTFPDNYHPPFQTGLCVGDVIRFTYVSCSIRVFLGVFTDSKLSFDDYCRKLYEIEKESKKTPTS